MSQVNVRNEGDAVAVLIPRAMWNKLGIESSDELDLSFNNQEIVLRSRERAERARKIKAAADEVFVEYKDVLHQLAEGAK